MNTHRTSVERFPILDSRSSKEIRQDPWWPVSIPWDLIAPHEKQAVSNHGQDLRRLAERGGLSPAEMWAVLNDKTLREVYQKDQNEAMREIMTLGGLRFKK